LTRKVILGRLWGMEDELLTVQQVAKEFGVTRQAVTALDYQGIFDSSPPVYARRYPYLLACQPVGCNWVCSTQKA
jgi:hypothetical protein